MIRVGIVDDHPVVLDGLVASLTKEPGIAVMWTAATLMDARAAMASTPCDVVLVDVRLPDGSGLDLLAASAPSGGPRFVVLSSFDRPQYGRAAFKRGAVAYILKTAPIQEVIEALSTAMAGGTTSRPDRLAGLAGASLTARELEIVRLVARGSSNDEIAMRLAVSRKTVEAYLTKLFERWQVGTRTELALRAEREGWLDVGTEA